MEKINIGKLLLGLEKATAIQIAEFRHAILFVYRVSNIRQFLPNDKNALCELKEGIANLLTENKGADKVVQLQYSWLLDNLETVLENYEY